MKSTTYALIAVAAIAAFALLREHWSHVAGYWPYLLLLVCPLMHLSTATEGMEIINITEVKTIKKLIRQTGRVAVPLSVRIVRSLWHAQRHAVRVCYQRVPLPERQRVNRVVIDDQLVMQMRTG